MKTLHATVAAVGLVVASGLAWWWQNRPAPAPVAAATSAGPGAPGVSGGSGGPGAPGGPGGGGPASVEVGKAVVMTLEDDAQAVGTLQAKQGVMLRPEVSGRVSRVGFQDGQVVKRGQVLLQLDDTLQQAQLRQAQAQAAIARTNLQRQRDLVAQNFVSQSAVDQTAAALEVAQAQVALNSAQLARMRLLAPFDGMVGIGNVDRGDYIKEGADVVAIEDLSVMQVDFRLPERYAARVKKGQNVSVALDALPGQNFTAHVQALDSQVEASGRSLLVRASIDNTARALRSGMFARARIVFETRTGAVVVPEEALVPQGGRQFVIKLVDTAQGKASQKVEAKLGMRTAGKVEMLQGINAGDVVVTAGQARLMARDGVPVRVIDLDKPVQARGGPPAGAGGAAAPAGAGGTSSPAGAGGTAAPAGAGGASSASPK